MSQELGLDVAVESMRHTLPGVVRYEGVRLADPETGRELFRCVSLDATWSSMTDSQGQTRPAIVLVARQAESPASAWERLQDVLRRRLECQGGRPELEIRASADQWKLRDETQLQVLHSVEGGVGVMPGGIQAQLAFHLSAEKSAKPIRLRIVRNRQVSPPANSFEMDTGSNFVPCRLMAMCVKEFHSLGPQCRFAGYAALFHTPGGPSGEIHGQVLAADLGSLAQQGAISALTGTADLPLLRAKFHCGRLEELAGRLTMARGALGRELTAGLTAQLQWTAAPGIATTDQSLVFDRLDLDFWIDPRGVSIAGRCREAPGAVATAGSRVVLTQPGSQPQPVAALIAALSPGDVRLPATQQAGWLARLLPMPGATSRR